MSDTMDGLLEELLNERRGGTLGGILRQLKLESGLPLDKLTVLSASNDPFRLDTPTHHKNGAWLRDAMKACGITHRRLHLRGIHYALMSKGIKKPDGKPYKNNLADWTFLQDKASKAARWLGYVGFGDISDARNTEPVVIIHEARGPGFADINTPCYGVPDIDDFKVSVSTSQFRCDQPYKLVISGEKTSLEPVLSGIARRFGADLYLPSGEISDTMLHQMASNGAQDGREMVVFVVADCDPSGYQMAASIAHKLRALRELKFPELEFRVETPALTVEQVKQYGLPSSTIKETEPRGKGWVERYGVEQTEVDAIATLQPDLFRHIITSAIAPFYDETLSRRLGEAHDEWQAEADRRFDEAMHAAGVDLDEIYGQIETNISWLQDSADRLRDAVENVYVDFPTAVVPEAEIGDLPDALASSGMGLLEAIQRIRDRKNYGGKAA